MGSSDTAITIAFGLISVSISLIGVWISYLTLRAMSLDTSASLFSTSPTLALLPFSQEGERKEGDFQFSSWQFMAYTGSKQIITTNCLSTTSESFDTNTLSSFPSHGIGDGFLGWHETPTIIPSCGYEDGVRASRATGSWR
ncbi:uncharacterized protein K444DRAFT_630379 [Hyaloscypha bicolor E]|uniref:Uncharacterized protein n=1 Tax=Hyaloscypha bicolor E TaxID=1095630 RepID=A0A2J6T6N7_9HELO|nr:uncharacterized protein K444DRAFT_630379 [Hyaloscypha bicolor E]PMD58674.1 hypothetical protein K444DRAFT_630379 [Hyaloscypha bicolor E]